MTEPDVRSGLSAHFLIRIPGEVAFPDFVRKRESDHDTILAVPRRVDVHGNANVEAAMNPKFRLRYFASGWLGYPKVARDKRFDFRPVVVEVEEEVESLTGIGELQEYVVILLQRRLEVNLAP